MQRRISSLRQDSLTVPGGLRDLEVVTTMMKLTDDQSAIVKGMRDLINRLANDDREHIGKSEDSKQWSRTTTTEQLGASSSDRTSGQGLADGRSRAATVDSAPHVRAPGQHKYGRAQGAPPDTSTGQSIRPCLRREVPATRERSDEASRDDTALAGLEPGSQGKLSLACLIL